MQAGVGGPRRRSLERVICGLEGLSPCNIRAGSCGHWDWWLGRIIHKSNVCRTKFESVILSTLMLRNNMSSSIPVIVTREQR